MSHLCTKMVSLKSKSLFPFFHMLLVLLVLTWSKVAVSSGFTVRSLPGFKGPLPFHLETGYVGVDEGGDVQLFYYFVHSERNPKEDPLVLWLVGGPRCTALMSFAYILGPLSFKTADSNGSLPNLVLNPNSWTQVANIIFLDAPVDTGFSYWSTAERFLISDTISAQHTHQFLQNWLTDHPEFLSNALYIGGDSYSGITVPVIVEELINGIEAGKEPHFNFKGYLLGNPVTSPYLEDDLQIQYAHNMGLISDELYESIKQNCKSRYTDFSSRNMECLKDQEAFNECVSGINIFHILEPSCCTIFSPEPKVCTRRSRRSLASVRKYPSHPTCRQYSYMLSEEWANDERVRKALHIREGTIGEWIRCNYDFPYEYDIHVQTTIEYHRNLSSRGYRSLIYSGDHDLLVPHISTESWIRLLNLSIADDWHPWLVDHEISGYTRTFSNGMTYATVKGGGHTAAEYRPKECFAMFKRWIDYDPL